MTYLKGSCPNMHIYDAIIVGARVAGCATGMLLAKAGFDILVVDRDALPSDKPHSTHLIHPPGIRRLRDWGLLQDIENSGCPPIHEYGLAVGTMDLMAPLPPDGDVSTAFAPRRRVLDAILLDAAVAAGAEVRPETLATGLVYEQERVVGVRLRSGGREVVERARLVIGADGVNSRVGTWAGAQKYLERPRRLTSIWSYWTGTSVTEVPTWRDDHNYAFAWPTNDGAVLAGVTWRSEDFKRLKIKDKEAALFGVMDRFDPQLAAQMRVGERIEEWRTGSVPNYFRESFGAGWALVGDAGYCRDPSTAAGITDALRSAEYLAEEIICAWEGKVSEEQALARYEYRRNVRQRPIYEYTTDFARLDPYPSDVLEIMTKASSVPRFAQGLTGLFAQTQDPLEFFSPHNMSQILRETGAPESFRIGALKAISSPNVYRLPGVPAVMRAMLASRLGDMGDYLREAERARNRWRGMTGWQSNPELLEEKWSTPAS
ncbi:NAD(P)/FAD-dependent oxidoreductase [Kocuria soli]|nr:NAD(P)/FAD-dependent oxidoreductase [Kocuria soli]